MMDIFTPTVSPKHMPGELWFVAAYFNPTGSEIILSCFERFYKQLCKQTDNILIVEAAFDGHKPHQLQEIVKQKHLKQVTAPSWVFLKERLLNIAIDSLPDSCDKVCWTDADLIFPDDFVSRVASSLDTYKVIQPFRRVLRLKDGHTESDALKYMEEGWQDGQITYSSVYCHTINRTKLVQPGFVWAARRYIIKECGGIYDRDLGGSSDRLWSCAILGTIDSIRDRVGNVYHRDSWDFYQQWACEADEIVSRSVGFINCDIIHLYHGSTIGRKHIQRIEELCEGGFTHTFGVGMTVEKTYTICKIDEDVKKAFQAPFIATELNTATLKFNPIKSQKKLPGSLWVLTTHFNPAGYKSRKENFISFYKNLRLQNVNVLAVEMAVSEDQLELKDVIDGKNRYVPIISDEGTKLWQKERMMNIGLNHLPDRCDKVVWLDADMLFTDKNWAIKTAELLEDYVVVQPFYECVKLTPSCKIPNNISMIPYGQNSDMTCCIGNGFIYAYLVFGQRALVFDKSKPERWGEPGYGCGFRRSLLDKHGFYDLRPDGASDTYLRHAVLGEQGIVRTEYRDILSSEEEWLAYCEWANPFHRDIGQSYAFLDIPIFHLYHGSVINRQYVERQRVLRENHFNPTTDIVICKNEPLRWSPLVNPKIRKFMAKHYYARREDG